RPREARDAPLARASSCARSLPREVPAADDVLGREDLLVDLLRIGLGLLADLLDRVEELLGVALAERVHVLAREDAALGERRLEAREAVGLFGHEVRARGGRVPVEARDHRLEEEWLSLLAHIVHRLLDAAVRVLGIVAVDRHRLHPEGATAIADA